MTSEELLRAIEHVCEAHRRDDLFADYTATRITRAGAALYCQQHGIFTRHSRQMWAQVVANCPELSVRRFIVNENLVDEEGSDEGSHYLMLSRMGQALGSTAEGMDRAVPLSTTRLSLLVWETLTKNRHWLLGAAAKAALEMKGNAAATGRMWVEKLGLTREQAHFFFLHEEADAVHGPVAMTMVLRYLSQQRSVSNAELYDAVCDSQSAFWVFRTGCVEAAEALS